MNAPHHDWRDDEHVGIPLQRLRSIWAKQADIAAGLCMKFQAVTRQGPVIDCLKIIQNRAMQAMNTLNVLYHEADHNYQFDAAVLLRGLWDVHLQALYILQEPELRAMEYMEFLHVQTYDLVKLIDKNDSDLAESVRSSLLRPLYLQNVMANFGAVRAKFLTQKGDKCRQNWYKGKLSGIAEAVGFHAEYEIVQSMLSGSVHSTPFALINGAGLPRTAFINYGWIFNFRILGGISKYFGFQLDEYENLMIRLAQRSVNNLNDADLPGN